MSENPIAHVRKLPDDSWELHDLFDHLVSVGRQAEKNADFFQSAKWAEIAGKWHDLGKYSPKFQHYIRSASGFEREQAHVEAKGRIDHSTAGAIHAVRQWGDCGRVLAYLIAGHHAGLPDWEKLEAGTGGALRERLQQTELLDEVLASGVPAELLEAECPAFKVPGGAKGFALWARMLFSCLVDADFLDTEAFMDGAKAAKRGGYPTLSELRDSFDRHMAALQEEAPDTPVNRLRRQIFDDCRRAAQQPPGIYSLTVPTGGGKTLSGMAFALDHALARNKRRIIHVIPYTSIIEQTAEIFRNIFGEAVIEHHSSLDPERETARSRLAAENWDAPVIVTTSVQFFESLFAARTSRCRKLHNIVGSVVVLDEAQLMPPEFLQPILDVLNLLVEHYGVTVVLSTATQPALQTRRDSFGKIRLRGLDSITEIIPDPDRLYAALDRVDVHLPADLNRGSSWEDIAEAITRHESVLAIVNTRRQARELHRLMPKGTVHLSALMCGQHRSDVIAGIKQKLKQDEAVRVVSTQLVEAGVDLDFPVVYRALAGLDSIAQAAGRCNREGILQNRQCAQGVTIAQAAGRCNREGRRDKGQVVVFVPPEPPPPGFLRRAASKSISVLSAKPEDPLSREGFTRFFQLFYDDCELDKHGIDALLTPDNELACQFRTAAKRFRLIEDSGQSILVRYYAEEGDLRIDALLNRLKAEGPSRWLMRKLQRYSVTVSEWHFQQLQADSQIEEIWPGIWAQMAGTTIYDNTLGLHLDSLSPAASELVI